MKKIIIIFLFLVIILLSCNRETFELPSTQKQSTEILQNSLNKSKQNDNKNLQEFLKNKEKEKILIESEIIKDEEGYDKLIDIEDENTKQNLLEIINVIFS